MLNVQCTLGIYRNGNCLDTLGDLASLQAVGLEIRLAKFFTFVRVG